MAISEAPKFHSRRLSERGFPPPCSSGSLAIFAAIRRPVLGDQLGRDPIGCPLFSIIAERGGPIREEGNGMVQAENIDSRCSSFQLDDRSRRDHHSLAHLSKLPLSGAGTPPPHLIALPTSDGGLQSHATCFWKFGPCAKRGMRARSLAACYVGVKFGSRLTVEVAFATGEFVGKVA
jgi:hypothetical protein